MSDTSDFDTNSPKTFEQLRAELDRAELEKARLQAELENEALRAELEKTRAQMGQNSAEQSAEPGTPIASAIPPNFDTTPTMSVGGEHNHVMGTAEQNLSAIPMESLHKKTDKPLPFRGVPLLPPDEIERLKQESDTISIARGKFYYVAMGWLFFAFLLAYIIFALLIIIFGPPDIDWSFLSKMKEEDLKPMAYSVTGFAAVALVASYLGERPWLSYAKEALEEMVLFGEKESTAKTQGEIARANMILALGKGEALAKIVEEANDRADATFKNNNRSSSTTSTKNAGGK